MAPSVESTIWQPFKNQIQVLGLDVYNGNNAQLGIFRQTTGVTFPLLLQASNGTPYGAGREDILVVDQAGIVRLKVHALSSGSRQRAADQVRDLLANPPTQLQPPVLSLSTNAATETAELGQTISHTVTLSNTGGSDLVVTNIQPAEQAFSDHNLMLSQTAFTLSPGAMQDITVTIMPTQKGTLSDNFQIHSNAEGNPSFTVSINIPNEIPFAVNDTVRIMPEERINIPVLQNDLDPDNDMLTVTDVTQGSHSERVVVNSDGTVHYRPNPDNPATDNFTYTIADGWGGTATATVVIIVTQPETPMVEQTPTAPVVLKGDFNNNGQIDFPDFLLFAQAYNTIDPQYDLNEDGPVDFSDFLIFAQLFVSSQN